MGEPSAGLEEPQVRRPALVRSLMSQQRAGKPLASLSRSRRPPRAAASRLLERPGAAPLAAIGLGRTVRMLPTLPWLQATERNTGVVKWFNSIKGALGRGENLAAAQLVWLRSVQRCAALRPSCRRQESSGLGSASVPAGGPSRRPCARP